MVWAPCRVISVGFGRQWRTTSVVLNMRHEGLRSIAKVGEAQQGGMAGQGVRGHRGGLRVYSYMEIACQVQFTDGISY